MIVLRHPEDIYQVTGRIERGTFSGRWHFSFDRYYDPEYERFGALRVFNDDTLTPGSVWPLHPHRDNEVVTYCAGGVFRHEDERGKGGLLKKGWAQHTTVGKGMYHSEINELPDKPMRFIQMWFLPKVRGLDPSVEQKPVEPEERKDRLLPLVSNVHPGALRINSDARVFSSTLTAGNDLSYEIEGGRGAYLYVLEGGPVVVNQREVETLAAIKVQDERTLSIKAVEEAELLLVDVGLN